MRGRKRSELSLTKARSSITNGSSILADVDHRTSWMRRLRDVLQAHEADLGGAALLSEGQRAIIRRAAMLELQCEMMDQKFAENEGIATQPQIEVYQRASSTLRRLLESLGLHQGRKARDVTPTLEQYARSKERERLTA